MPSVKKDLVWILLALSCLLSVSFSFNPIDEYLLDCGSSTNTTVNNRVFVPDNSGFVTLKSPQSIIGKSSLNSISSFGDSTLYQTARIFSGISTYSFPIHRQGRHWIRLYFFPFVYQSYNLTTAIFSVSTQSFTLLSDFQAQNASPIFKEYSLNITTDVLLLNFIPFSNSFAFINAIELVSVPDNLIMDDAQSLNPLAPYQGLSNQVLETVYRINMGGPMVMPSNDSLGRTWIPDQSFLVPPNSAKSIRRDSIKYPSGGATEDHAPQVVYATARDMNVNVSNANFNITWEFSVDSGFEYLIRMHFCDIVSTSLNQLYFNVYVNGWIASRDFDLSSLTFSTPSGAYFVDFVGRVMDVSRKVRISVGPSTLSPIPDAILNGLEIMKMNNSKSSLDGLSSVILPAQSGSKNIALIAGCVVTALVVIILFIVLSLIVVGRREFYRKCHSKTWVPFTLDSENIHTHVSKFSNGTVSNSVGESPDGFRFSFMALQEATNNFDENHVIGVGGFGKVYRGVLRDGTKVAAKRGHPGSQQGLNEFRTEIEMLSKFRHRHLVSLVGYCDENNEMILVYEYMENGTLKRHLYGSDLPSLSWKQRLEISIGAAKGLHYLHTGSNTSIIHRDVKSANILLDENFMAKVADFGLSKTGPEFDKTHVSTAVKGSFGYLDPEYFRRQQLTEKSDVYSFGVVLFEVLCARPVIDPSLPREMVNLAEWAMTLQRRGELEKIIDSRLVGNIRTKSLKKFVETAEKCLSDYGVDRPPIVDVLWNLEYCLQLQEDNDMSKYDHREVTTNQISSEIDGSRNVSILTPKNRSELLRESMTDLS